MEKVKLIIWDLDECFWKGTLSDGAITPIDKHIELVKHLTDRGIINAICSKNDYDKVEKEFNDNPALGKDLYDLFVFNSIDWTAKGNRIKQMISDMNLRCVNVLFVDDNIQNLKETQFVCEGIQVALPDELFRIIEENPECFEGKDDAAHERLNQYKVLQTKVKEKSNAGSNEEFLLQSDIRVELIEKDLDFDRIHEMIHRNNQLNFTKDRISKEEVASIFGDANIRSGIVRVSDKYGDHGVVGCYALKDNVLLQFVFSCRILGMGVEQYVYGILGSPEITVVGEVASELVKGVIPSYINQKGNGSKGNDSDSQYLDDNTRMIVFGTCPLRPVWGYLEPKIKNIRFVDHVPATPVCNLGMMFEDAQYNSECLENVKLFVKESFCQDIIDGNLDWLLITFTNECEMYKYTDEKTGKRFYSNKLSDTTASPEFLERYTETRITPQDVYEEITNLCKRISKNVKIIIQTVTDVVFEQFGENLDYHNRVECNEVAERLAKENDNVFLADIRKYATNMSDFFDSTPNHYNRAIGYKLAMDILGIMGISENEDSRNNKNEIIVPKNAYRVKISMQSGDIKYESEMVSFISNSQLVIRLQKTDDVTISYKIYRGRTLFIEMKDVKSDETLVSINKKGVYRVSANIVCGDVVKEAWINDIPYNEFNYEFYLNPNSANYDAAKGSIDQFINDNVGMYILRNRQIRQMTTLLANGCNIADYFLERGVDEISIFANDGTVLSMLVEQLNVSKIKIANIYTDEMIYAVSYGGGYSVKRVDGLINNNAKPNEKILFAGTSWASKEWEHFRKRLYQTDSMVTLDYVLSYLMTKTFFPSVRELNGLKNFMCVRASDFSFGSFYYSRSAILPVEKEGIKFSIDGFRKAYANGAELDNESFKNVDKDVLLETTKCPAFVSTEISQNRVLGDVSGRFLNIKGGFRRTLNQPESYMGKIYICGDLCALGAGSSDENTIASQLQKMVGKSYKVENCAWNWNGQEDFNNMLRMLKTMKFTEKDILIVLTKNNLKYFENQNGGWFNYDALDDSYIKVDTHPMFYDLSRPQYFLMRGVYTAECNRDIAALLKNKIDEVIK